MSCRYRTCIDRSAVHPPCLQALLNSSHMYYEAAKHFQHYGVTVGNLGYDWGQMQKQKNDAVSGLTKGIEGLFKKNKVGGGQGSTKAPWQYQGAVAADCESRPLGSKQPGAWAAVSHLGSGPSCSTLPAAHWVQGVSTQPLSSALSHRHTHTL
jgi:hypothetical protein